VNGSSNPSSGFTFYAGFADLQTGAFITPYIPTTSATVTRSAPTLTMALSAMDFNALEGTAYVEFSQANVAAGFPRAFCLNDGTANNAIQVVVNGSGDVLQGEILTGGVQQFSNNTFSSYTGAQTRVALAWAANNCQIAKDGGANAADTAVTLPAVTTLTLGNEASGGSPLNGWLSKFALYPRHLSQNEITAMSTL
jgi:hypothetical protein